MAGTLISVVDSEVLGSFAAPARQESLKRIQGGRYAGR